MNLWNMIKMFRNKIEAQIVSYNPHYSVVMYDTVEFKEKLSIFKRPSRTPTDFIIDP